MVVTFRVQKAYKGDVGAEVQIHTGLGGGDCGALFTTGLDYLIYTGPNLGQLGVSMCSPGGWLGGTNVSTERRYLRNERPTSADLAPLKPWARQESVQEREQEMRRYEEDRKRYAAATGRICGALIRQNASEGSGESIAFLSTQGYSPNEYPESRVNEHGSFCSPDLGPGNYYLYLVQALERSKLALYYPGVADVADATTTEVRAGQSLSDIAFKAAQQRSYSVRGFISADEKAAFSNEVFVGLIRSDGDRRVWYRETAKARLLPRVVYFKFDNVVPGRYVAYLAGTGPGWLTKKVEVNVTTHMKFISLELVRKK